MMKKKDFFRKMLSYLKEWRGIVLILYLFLIMSVNLFVKWEGELSLSFVFRLIIVLVVSICICPIALWRLESAKICLRDKPMAKVEKAIWTAFFFLLSFGVLFLWYLAYYPGAFSSDALYQFRQTLSGDYHDWKPILQTLITFTLPFKLTGRADCIVLFQIIEYSCILTYMSRVLLRYGGKCFALISLLYILLNPVTGNIAVCPWKDVTFAMFAVLLLSFGLQIHITDGKWLESRWAWWAFGIVLVITTLARHNGFLFTAPLLAAVLMRLGRERRLEILLFFFVCFGLLKGCIYPLLSVNEEWNYQTRVLGLPLTVLGNVAKESPDALDGSTKEFLYSIAPEEKWSGVYLCGSFNSIKWQTDQPLIEETGAVKVISMAVKSVFRAPVPALRALFSLTDMVYTVGGDTDWKISLSMGENDLGLEFHEILERSSFEDYTEYSRESILKYLFWEVGVVNLIIIGSVLGKCRFSRAENWKRALPGLAVLCYNFGMMLLLSGNDFRYFYYCFPVFPVILLILFGEKTEEQKENKKRIDIKEFIKKWKVKEKLKHITLILKKRFIIMQKMLLNLNKTLIMYSCLFSSIVVVGKKMRAGDNSYFLSVNLADILQFGLGFLFFLVIGMILPLILKNKFSIGIQGKETAEKFWFFAGLLLVLVWSPYLFAYYPESLLFLILFWERSDIRKEKSRRNQKEQVDIIGQIKQRIKERKRWNKALIIFAFFLSCMIVIGEKISMENNPYFQPVVLMDFLWIGILFLIILTVGSILLRIINNKCFIEIRDKEIPKKWWLCAWLFLVVFWSPYLLAYYPGTLSPDSFTSLLQADNLALLYNHVPVAYTLLIAFFARLGWAIGDANFGVFLFTLVQLSIMAGVLSYSAYWIRKKIRNQIAALGVLFFYGLNPIVALHSITMWKDVLYSAWIVLLCLFLFDMAIGKGKKLEEKKNLIHLGILFALISFGRNNGIYIVIFSWVVLLLVYKKVRKKLLIGGGSVILSILLIQGPGYKLMGIASAGFAESVGIPIQQICYTVVTDGPLQQEEREFLERIIPIPAIEEKYSPVAVDNIKFSEEFNTSFFEQNKSEFLKLYFNLFLSHPRAYVQSYLLSTSGFWHVEPIYWFSEENICENDMGIFNINYFEKYFHYDWKEFVAGKISSLRNRVSTNVGLMVWLVFFYVVASLSQKQSWKAFLALPLIGCWITLMLATPVSSQFRYVYYYHLMLPIVCILFFAKRKENADL